MEKTPLTPSEQQLFEALQGLKSEVDDKIMQNAKVLENESFAEKMILRSVIHQFKNQHKIPIDAPTAKRINRLVVKEYMNEFYDDVA